MNVFGTNLNVDYRRLLPSASQDTLDDDMGYGIYEDEETQMRRQGGQPPVGIDSENPLTRCLAQITDMMPNLSFQERMLGCATCIVAGYLLSFGSFMRFKSLLTGNPTPIVVHVTLGNILALCGTCFLSGANAQVQRMWHPSRRGASLLYVGSMWVTLVLLLLPSFVTRGFILFLMIILQYVAVTWYCLSYIPFGRDIIKRFCLRIVASSEELG